VPAAGKLTLPGVCSVELPGEPPGNTQEYWAAPDAAPKKTDPPALIVTSDAGEVIVPSGGGPANGDSWMNLATEGTPAPSSRNSM
jgi:hypothetical protein